jgi:hypothetical protein
MIRLVVVLLAPALAACSSCGKGARTPAPAAPETAAPAPASTRSTVYDDEGIRLPREELAFGTPVPVGLERSTSGKGWIRFSGPVRPREVIDFYRRYLTLPEGTAPHEVGNATQFRDARPRQPGNPGRPVEVRVISEGRGMRTGLLILDIVQLEKAGDKAWEKEPIVDPRKWQPSSPGEKVPSDLL